MTPTPHPRSDRPETGRMLLRAGDRSLDLVSGDVVAMEVGLTHAADAQVDTAFLLTIVEGGLR